MTSVARNEETIAAHGARWYLAATLTVGALNYGYVLLLTHLLDVASSKVSRQARA